jgi:hypothetical protein
MQIRHGFLILCSALLLASGCKKDDPVTVDLGYGYFPTNIGHWVEYQVDSVYLNLIITGNETLTLGDTASYPLREVLAEAFADPEGRPAQRIIRYRRDGNNVWLPRDVWWQTRDERRAERAEENRRRIKLIFKPGLDQYWNTNATNTTESLELTYDEVDVPWDVNGMSFDSTVLVTTTYTNNLVNTITYKERYAKNVGLVYREVDSTERQTGTFEGWYFKQVITGYGQ